MAALAAFPGLLALCYCGDIQDPNVGSCSVVTAQWDLKPTTRALWEDHIWGELAEAMAWEPKRASR